jgi:hypothetical protein
MMRAAADPIRRRLRRLIVTSAAVLLSAACSTPDLSAPTVKFAQVVDQSAAAIEADFSGEFGNWQRSYIAFHAMEGTRIDRDVLEGRTRPAGEPTVSFSPDAIKIRIQIIEGIRAYAVALSNLAGTTAPGDIVTDGEKISTDLDSLVKTASGKDPSFSAYATPISGIAAWFGEQYVQ